MVTKFVDNTKLFRGLGLRTSYDGLQIGIETKWLM